MDLAKENYIKHLNHASYGQAVQDWPKEYFGALPSSGAAH
jgi:hypothetical protein